MGGISVGDPWYRLVRTSRICCLRGPIEPCVQIRVLNGEIEEFAMDCCADRVPTAFDRSSYISTPSSYVSDLAVKKENLSEVRRV
jgi:hypothetical protein